MASFDFYFQPKFFEKSGRIYEWIGVQFFQKYSPTGRMSLDYSWSSASPYSPSLDGVLQKYESVTRLLELVHIELAVLVSLLGFLIIYGARLVGDEALGNNIYIPITFIIFNVIGNFYQIFLQRYNRARIYRILERKEFLKKTIRRQSR